MVFFEEPEISDRSFRPIAPGVRRSVANNPGKMTYRGTNTYLIETPDGLYLLDPGPSSDETHFVRMIDALDVGAAGIVVSHHHSDHFGAALRLQQATGLPIYAHARFADDTFRPDVALEDEDRVGGMTVLHTPGHASDHICLAREDGVVFTADHVMSWSSSIVMLPDGDMGAYVTQLQRLIARNETLYLPGHGPAIPMPIAYVERLLANRMRREQEIAVAIARQPSTPAELAKTLYGKTDNDLAWAAERNVDAHLEKLRREGLAWVEGGLWHG